MEDSLEAWLRSKHPEEDGLSVCKSGDVVGDWKILALLGKGGSAEVYRVEHVRSGQVGALKLLCKQEAHSRKRFLQECDLLRAQKLSCFARYFDAGEKDGRLFLVTEELHRCEFPHKDPQVSKFILEVCKAVSVLHSEGYVHRDLKPDNIMQREDSSYVLIDLGLVKKMSTGGVPQFSKEQLSIVGAQRVCVGTPGFSAPEQFIGGEIGVEADIHALGVLANECFGGKPPKHWIRIIDSATSSIVGRRFKSVEDLSSAIVLAGGNNVWFRSVLTVSAIPLAASLILFILTLIMPLMPLDVRQTWFGAASLAHGLKVCLAFVVATSIIPLGILKSSKWVAWFAMIEGAFFLLGILCIMFTHERGLVGWFVGFDTGTRLGFLLWMIPRSVLFVMLCFPRDKKLFKQVNEF